MIVPKVLAALVVFAFVAQGQLIPPISTTVGSPLTSSLFYQSLSPQTCCTDQTITVYGSATIQAAPDTATLNVQITVNSDTVKNAIAALSSQINCVITILNANGLNSSNYQTSSLSVYPNTSYSNGVSTVIGQIATESFIITIPILSPNASNVGKLIDNLATVNGIILNGLSFDIADKTDELAQARANAFSNAQKKALDYATSLQICLGQLVTIVDSYSSAPVVQPTDGPIMMMSNSIAATPTTINVGTIAISYNV